MRLCCITATTLCSVMHDLFHVHGMVDCHCCVCKADDCNCLTARTDYLLLTTGPDDCTTV